MNPGSVRAKPQPNRSQAHPGVHPLSQYTHASQKFQPLPTPIGQPPYHYDLETTLPGFTRKATNSGSISFHSVGDTGGIKDATFQDDVAAAMVADLETRDSAPSFFYHLGDVVYFNGEVNDYYSQFYEPYEHYTAPIFSIPGNHDGDPVDENQVSLDGWVRYFMTPTPTVDALSRDAPRVTLSLPNVYWTLEAPFLTIIGMYTNVPEHGSIDSVQQQWLTYEFDQAPKNKALIVALHHPVYSFDVHHSGSSRMADALQQAINDSRRVPNLVLTGHVHNFQRIEKKVHGNQPMPVIVVGGGGYHNLHHLNAAVGTEDSSTGAKLIAGIDHQWSYATITVDATHIHGTDASIARDGTVQRDVNKFQYGAGAISLPAGASANL